MEMRSRVVRQAGHPVLGDAYGLELLDCYEGRGRYEVVERDDGYIDTGGDVLFYFGTFPAWPAHVQEALRAVHGRVLDIGCGAGRHALYCQENGLPVVGIDNSPLAVEVCRRRGVQDVRCMSITQLSRRLGVFDTILMLGNNFGLFGSYRRAKWLLRRFDGMTSDDAMLIAETMDPYQTDNPDHLAYHELNRRRGRMSGQVRIRIRTRAVATAWFDYLFVSRPEMEDIVAGTGWRVRRYLTSSGPGYVALLEKNR